MGQVRSQEEDWEVEGCCPRRAGSCGWCKKLKGSGEWAESRWEEQCICWWPFVPGEEKKAALHRVAAPTRGLRTGDKGHYFCFPSTRSLLDMVIIWHGL